MNDAKTLKVIIFVLAALLIINIGLIFSLLPEKTAAPPPTPSPAAAKEVQLTIITPAACEECFDASLYQPELARLGVNFSETKQYDENVPEAKQLIQKYKLTKLPTVIFSKELGTYSEIAGEWSRIGTIAADGSYLLEGTNPPYYELTTKSVRGLVSLIYLNDSSCTECYDVTFHRQVLERFGMRFKEIKTVDAGTPEGKSLIAMYNITAVPTIIIDKEASEYLGFEEVWQSVGVNYKDHYIFSIMSALGEPYKDLATNNVVTPQVDAGLEAN